MNSKIHPLKIWLLEQNITQRMFSLKTGIHEVVLSRIVNGKGNPDLQTLAKIYQATNFEVSMDDICRYQLLKTANINVCNLTKM